MIALLLALALQAQDPVVVRARLQEEAIRVGETSVLRVDVETTGARARIGTFRSLPPGVELEGTRSFDQRQFGLPGGTRRFISREFVLRVRAAGRYRIPSIDITVENDVYSTTSQLLIVLSAEPPAGAGATSNESEGVVLRTWLDADTVTVGEQVTLEAEALFSPDARLRLRRAPEYEPPSPSGFWIHDLPDRGPTTNRLVGQDRYEVQRFTRILFPLAPGQYEIPPARLEYEVRRGLLYAPETRELRSEPLRLVVEPVPEARPPGFTGAVGRFTVQGRLEPEKVPAGEAAVLTLEVSGTGNVKALPPPELPPLEGIDVFPPSEEAETEVRDGVLQGTKRFSWVLIPRRPGRVQVPALSYPYYDPDLGTFESATLPPQPLDVAPGADSPDAAIPPALRYLDPEPSGADPLAWVRSSWFAALQLLPLLALIAALAWRRGLYRRPSRHQLRRVRRTELRALEGRVAEDGVALYADAEAAARAWLAQRLGVPAVQSSHVHVLTAAGVPAETAAAVRRLLGRLRAGRYAPTPPGPEARRDTIRALGRILERVDREAPAQDGGEGRPLAGLGIVLLLAGVTAVGAAAVQGPAPPDRSNAVDDAPFTAGVQAFDNERYAAAVSSFQHYVQTQPGDAAGWYNLGNAFYRDGRSGYAVWAWLKVLTLDPRHGDARHNLGVAGVAPELTARVSPPLRLRAPELFLLAALAWLVTGVLGVIGLVASRRRVFLTAGGTLVLALTLAVAGWVSTRPPNLRIVVQEAPVRAGPNLRADLVTQLQPGQGLVPLEARGDWVRIRAAELDGWVEIAATEPL